MPEDRFIPKEEMMKIKLRDMAPEEAEQLRGVKTEAYVWSMCEGFDIQIDCSGKDSNNPLVKTMESLSKVLSEPRTIFNFYPFNEYIFHRVNFLSPLRTICCEFHIGHALH